MTSVDSEGVNVIPPLRLSGGREDYVHEPLSMTGITVEYFPRLIAVGVMTRSLQVMQNDIGYSQRSNAELGL